MYSDIMTLAGGMQNWYVLICGFWKTHMKRHEQLSVQNMFRVAPPSPSVVAFLLLAWPFSGVTAVASARSPASISDPLWPVLVTVTTLSLWKHTQVMSLPFSLSQSWSLRGAKPLPLATSPLTHPTALTGLPPRGFLSVLNVQSLLSPSLLLSLLTFTGMILTHVPGWPLASSKTVPECQLSVTHPLIPYLTLQPVVPLVPPSHFCPVPLAAVILL